MTLLTPIEPSPVRNSVPAPLTPRAPAVQEHAPVAGRVFLPDGTPLKMTLSRKMILGALFDAEDRDEAGELTGKIIPWGGPENPAQDLVVLYLCATQPEEWCIPSLCADNVVRMLYQNAPAFMARVYEWADESCLKEHTIGDLYPIVRELWLGSHGTFVSPLAEKKTQPPTAESPRTGPTNTPPSSPEETLPASLMSFTNSPSGTPTGSFMPGSTTRAASVSPELSGPGDSSKPAG